MSDKVFVDTNVLVYAYDQRDPNKQSQAQALLLKATQSQKAILSAQVLGEFFVVVTRKIPQPMTSSEAAEVIAELEAIEEAQRSASGNKAKAARLLGVPRSTLFSKLRKCRINKPR